MNGSKQYGGRLGWAVAALVGAMAADLAETLVDPANSGNATTIYDAAVRSHGAMVLSAGLLLLSSVLIVPGVIGVVRSLGGRALWLGRAAQTFALLGAIGHGALGGVYLMWASLPGGEGEPRAVDRRDRPDEQLAVARPDLPALHRVPGGAAHDVRRGRAGAEGAEVGAGRGRSGSRLRSGAPRLGSVLDVGRARVPDRSRARSGRSPSRWQAPVGARR